MKLLCIAFITAVVAVPLAAMSKSKATCCIIDPTTGLEVPDPDDCRCFGAYEPAPEHQQCMTAAPQYKNDRIKRSWQAGCWCINELTTCQDWCESNNTQAIRVLKTDKITGENEWQDTTVGDMVIQPVAVTDTEARTQCYNGCVSRGFCSDKLLHPWSPLPAAAPCQPLADPATFGVAYGGDSTVCTTGGIMAPGTKCWLEPLAGYWCRTNEIRCEAADEEGVTVVLSIPDLSTECFVITADPTKAPSPEPTTEPTIAPSPMPTPSPTMQPIANPTFFGCSKYDNLESDCGNDTADQCSYSRSGSKCLTCDNWTSDSANCQASTKCGFSSVQGKCLYCGGVTDATVCQGSTGCTWSGSLCY